jgi:hypothetical protein
MQNNIPSYEKTLSRVDRTGRQADGLLGDGFLTGQGRYTLQNPQ